MRQGADTLTIDAQGWLVEARRRASPNCDARPPCTPVSALIVHGITLPPGRFGHDQVTALFTNALDTGAHAAYRALAGLHVSAHVLIERDGRLTQYVGFDERAWHAGRSVLDGQERVNDFSVGIELEGTDHCPYTPRQYRGLAAVTDALMQRYPDLVAERIRGHSDIAPTRKTDPGPAFDWAWYRALCGISCT